MAKKITIENLKKHNRDFFSPNTVEMHGDKKYEIVDNPLDGLKLLKITYNKTKRRLPAFYSINPSTLNLAYYKVD